MTRRLTLISLLLLTIVLAACWPMLIGQRFAFRDVSHFYLPLYEYVADRTASQWLPLWNPLDQTGLPLIGESSTAVLYPIRSLVFSLPISSEVAMNIYLVFHLLLASATSAWLASCIGCRPIGIIAAGIVYPLSGSVFSLCCNPPFLVGAAWLPLALAACLGSDRNQWSGRSRRLQIAVAAIALSMMVLGGDPQAALHSVLVVVAVSSCGFIFRIWNLGRSDGMVLSSSYAQSIVVCSLASVLALSLASVQVAASADWSRQSVRSEPPSHRMDLYDFSLAPWHSLELLTPRPFGHPFPVNQRISKLIPGEGRMWTPSIYAGLVLGVAVLCRLLQPRTYFSDPWLGIAIVSLLLCFGHFGLVWVLQQIPGVLAEYGSATGGPFWILCEVIPGYTSFRYPVKWLPMLAIACSMVTARWISKRPAGVERSVLAALAVLFVCGASAAQWGSLHVESFGDVASIGKQVDEYWGPLDVRGGLLVARNSFLCSLAILSLLACLRLGVLRQKHPSLARLSAGLLIMLIALDCIANASLLLPSIDFESESRIAHQASPPPIAAHRLLRTQAGMWPESWKETQSTDRAFEVAVSERMAWFGRWHLTHRRAVFNSMVSIESRPYADFWHATRRWLTGRSRDSQESYWASVRQWLGIEAVSHVDASRTMGADGQCVVFVVRVLTEPVQEFRVWTDWRDATSMSSIVMELGRSGQVPLPHVAMNPPEGHKTERPAERQILTSPDSGVIRVSSPTPVLLERCVYQDGNWSALLKWKSGERSIVAPVLQSSLLKQAVHIPAGDWEVKFEYRPWWKWPSIILCGVSVLALAVLLFLPDKLDRFATDASPETV